MKYSFKIIGMTCRGCVNSIEQALKEQGFLESVSISLQFSELTFTSKHQYRVTMKTQNTKFIDLKKQN